MLSVRSDRKRMFMLLGLLLVCQFYVRPRLGNPRVAPDFLMAGLLVYAIRSRPGAAAVAGFLIGVLGDVLTPARFGAGALAHTLVGYLAAWGRAVFFADNLLVNAGFFAVGLWLRNLIVLLASGAPGDGLVTALLVWSPLQALTTAASGVIVLLVFRRWLDIRLVE
jgi:rod shape-determining protein MreD